MRHILVISRKLPTLEEMWRVIEQYGIKREMLETSNPTDKDVLVLYGLIKQKKHELREKEMIKLLKEYVEKIKKRSKS